MSPINGLGNECAVSNYKYSVPTGLIGELAIRVYLVEFYGAIELIRALKFVEHYSSAPTAPRSVRATAPCERAAKMIASRSA